MLNESVKAVVQKMITRCSGRHPTKGCELCYKNLFQTGKCEAVNLLSEHLCKFCKKADVKLVGPSEPWHAEQWQCPQCDSTYPITDYKKENEK